MTRYIRLLVSPGIQYSDTYISIQHTLADLSSFLNILEMETASVRTFWTSISVTTCKINLKQLTEHRLSPYEEKVRNTEAEQLKTEKQRHPLERMIYTIIKQLIPDRSLLDYHRSIWPFHSSCSYIYVFHAYNRTTRYN